MLITKTTQFISPVVVWCADSSLPENERNLAQIKQWWTSLDRKTIIWEVFNETIDFTMPALEELLVVESPFIEGNVLNWRKQGMENWNRVPVQDMVLDYSLERLDITPSLQDWFGVKYRLSLFPNVKIGGCDR